MFLFCPFRLARVACVVLTPGLLTQCSLLDSANGTANSAAKLLMAPVDLLNATLKSSAVDAPGGPVSEEELLRRAAEIQRSGDYQGREGIEKAELTLPSLAAALP